MDPLPLTRSSLDLALFRTGAAVPPPPAVAFPRRSAPPGRRKDLGAPTPDNRAAAGAAAGPGKEIRSEIEMILKKNNTVTVS